MSTFKLININIILVTYFFPFFNKTSTKGSKTRLRTYPGLLCCGPRVCGESLAVVVKEEVTNNKGHDCQYNEPPAPADTYCRWTPTIQPAFDPRRRRRHPPRLA